jgi:sugar/nucleoside kinase (ribokinase family)
MSQRLLRGRPGGRHGASPVTPTPPGRALVVGDVNIDIVFTGLPHLPRAEQDTLAQGLTITVGGQAGTLARALTRLGLAVSFVGRVGDDDAGRRCADDLARSGVDVSGLVVDPTAPTGTTVVLSTGSERGFATYPGAICAVRPSDVTDRLLAAADHLHVGSYFLLRDLHPHMAGLLRRARQHGLTTSCDPGWDSFLDWNRGILQVLDDVDVFLPNEVEAMQITGASTVEDALAHLAVHAGTVAIKRGGRGALARRGSETVALPAFSVPVIDVTSAGDIFNAGFLYAWLRNCDLADCLRFGSACGALAVSCPSNLGMPTLAEVEAFLTAAGEEPVDPPAPPTRGVATDG